MIKYQTICLEVSCSNIVQSTQDPRVFTVVLTADGGQETAYYNSNEFNTQETYTVKTYTCADIEPGMYFSNRDSSIWLINRIVIPCPSISNYTQVTVELYDIDRYNSLIDASEGFSSGAPLPSVLGYVYKLSSTGHPLINDVPNPPSETWLTSLIIRHFMYLTGGSGYTGATGSTGPAGNSTGTGVKGDTGVTGATGASGIGIPPGGTANQVLTKVNSTDYNVAWTTSSNGGGGNPIYNDEWIQQNFINAPPLVSFQKITATTTQIYVPWIYPTQFPIGLISSWIPVINNLSIDFSISLSSLSTYNVSALTNVSTNYISYNNGIPYITGIILSKLSGTSRIENSVPFPGLDTRNAYVYYDTQMASMISSMSSIINVSYGNTNPSTNIASIQLSTFLSAGPPTAPQNLLIYPITNSNATFSYTAPEYSDSTDYSSLLTIELYTVTYSSSGSSIRYPSAISDSLHTILNSTNLSYLATSLHPDSPYIFSVYAENTANINGPTVSTLSNTSNLLPSPVLSGTLQFPSRYYSNGTIKNILTNTSATHLVNSTTNWDSSTFITPIHNISTRGLNGGSNVTLMTISTILTSGSVSTIGPSISFTGFPAQTPCASTQNNITLTPNIVYDTYNTSSDYNQGFFLESQNSISIGSNTFVSSPYDYSINVLQFSTFSGSASFTYQYDGNPGIPSASVSTFTLSTNTSALVSGVHIIYGTPSFSVVTTASNLGTYYYTSPLLNYTSSITGSWSPSSEMTLSNIISGKTENSFTNPVHFSNTLSMTLTNNYVSSITLSVIANNASSSSSDVSATPIYTIIDALSYTLVYQTLPQSLPSIYNNSSAVIGYRILSGTAGPTNVPPFLNSGSSYALTPYDNSVDITTNQELQVSNGTFTTPSGQSLAYKNYTLFYYNSNSLNTVNYSEISGSYRYVTFAWLITPQYPNKYNTLKFIMNNSSGISIVNNLAYAGSNPIQLYYRFENASSPIPTNLSNPLTSAWINGNSQSGTSTCSGNYFLPGDYTQTQTAGLLSPVTISGQFSVFIPALSITNGTDVYLYCRVGLPLDSTFYFSHISASMS